MNYNETVFNEQIYAVRDFLFHYSSYRILHQNFDDLKNDQSIEFLVHTINAHYFQALNLWCMVFGANSNEIHWKKLKLNEKLKPIILEKLSISEKDYIIYWKKVTDWRNQYSAHRVPNYREATPDLKMARSIVFIYEIWLKKYMDTSIEFSLLEYENEYIQNVENAIKFLKCYNKQV